MGITGKRVVLGNEDPGSDGEFLHRIGIETGNLEAPALSSLLVFLVYGAMLGAVAVLWYRKRWKQCASNNNDESAT